jgi:hypothetical protein
MAQVTTSVSSDTQARQEQDLVQTHQQSPNVSTTHDLATDMSVASDSSSKLYDIEHEMGEDEVLSTTLEAMVDELDLIERDVALTPPELDLGLLDAFQPVDAIISPREQHTNKVASVASTSPVGQVATNQQEHKHGSLTTTTDP